MPVRDYQDTHVLVTGAAGFIGSHLVEELLARGANVRALYQYNSRNHKGWLSSRSKDGRLEMMAGDVRDPQQCEQMMTGVDTVFHLAALIGIPYSYLAPASYVETNIKGTLNIANAWRNCPDPPVLMQMSTSEVYGSAVYTPMDEEHVLQPQSPYSASKIGADALIKSYSLSYELPSVIVRPFNNYGPRQSPRAVIPTIISQAQTGASEINLGNLEAIRDFVFVKDTCRLIADLAKLPGAVGQTVNIGTGHSLTIRDLCLVIGDAMGVTLRPCSENTRIRPEQSEVDKLECNSERLTNLLGQTNFTPLPEGIKQTVKWFMDNGIPDSVGDYRV